MSDKLRFRKAPLLRFLFPFIVGLLGSYYLSPVILKETKLYFFVFLGSGMMLFIFYSAKKLHKFFDFVLIPFIILLAMCLTNTRLNIQEINTSETTHQGIIYDTPKLKNNSVLIPVQIKDKMPESYFKEQDCKAYLYTTKDSSLIDKYKVGDWVIFNTELKKITNSGNPNEFNYKRFMYNRGVVYQAFLPDSCLLNLGYHGQLPLKRISKSIQSKIAKLFDASIFSENAKALIVALTVGNKEYISDDMKSSFTNSGAVHVLAVSGLHVGIIYLILNYLLGFMNRSNHLKIMKTVLVVFFIWMYALITGLSPSVTRAALMFTLINIGTSLNRDISFYNILAGAALIMLVINPLNIFEVGFQLSFLAVGGIVFFQPLIYNWFSFSNVILDNVYKLFTVSLAAQITTAPLTIFYFNQFPSYFWLTNVFIIPLVFCLVFLAVLYLSFSWLPVLAVKIGWLLNLLANITNWWVRFVDSFPNSVIENISIGFFSLAALYILLWALSYWLIKRKSKPFIVGASMLLILLGLNIKKQIENKYRNQFIVYNISRQSAFGLYSDGKNYLLVSGESKSNAELPYAVQNHLIKSGAINNIDIVPLDSLKSKRISNHNTVTISRLDFNNKEIVLIQNQKLNRDELEKLNGDIFLIGTGVFPPKAPLNTEYIVVDGNLNNFLSGLWADYALKYGIKFHDTKVDGAFMLET